MLCAVECFFVALTSGVDETTIGPSADIVGVANGVDEATTASTAESSMSSASPAFAVLEVGVREEASSARF